MGCSSDPPAGSLPLFPLRIQQVDSPGCHLTPGFPALQALSADCIRNTSLPGRCDYFSNACCDLKSSNSFKSTAKFQVAYCHFAFSQTMDTQSTTSIGRGGADEVLMLKMALNLEKPGHAHSRQAAGARGAGPALANPRPGAISPARPVSPTRGRTMGGGAGSTLTCKEETPSNSESP